MAGLHGEAARRPKHGDVPDAGAPLASQDAEADGEAGLKGVPQERHARGG